ncbi:Putative ribonuclease H protein At1g65750 [Linum perenne]
MNIVERCHFWVQLSSSTYTKIDELRSSMICRKTTTDIGWRSAPWPMFTLNTDGSVIKATGEASAGDCLRDGNGNLVDAFSINIGKCSITRAEITCVATGLERAWATGVRNVEIQTDSTCVIKLLSGDWPSIIKMCCSG